MLSVTIPTFNRAARLQDTLDRILPQLTETARCVVFDNASTDGTPDVVAAAMRRSPFVRSVRNAANIGSGANFLRCFEVAPEGWVWLLSDDDSPDPHAIRTIEEEIARHPDACFINFATSILDKRSVRRPETTVTTGIDEFVEALDSFPNLLFMTAGVHNIGVGRRHLPLTYLEVASHAPQVAITLNALAADPKLQAVQSSRCIAEHVGRAVWNRDAVTLGSYRLLHLIPDLRTRRRFAEKVFELLPPTPAHGGFRRLLAGLRTSDTMLAEDVERYAILAATIHRYQWHCLGAIVCQIIAPFGVRRCLRGLYSLASLRRPHRPSTADPRSSIQAQLRADDRA